MGLNRNGPILVWFVALNTNFAWAKAYMPIYRVRNNNTVCFTLEGDLIVWTQVWLVIACVVFTLFVSCEIQNKIYWKCRIYRRIQWCHFSRRLTSAPLLISHTVTERSAHSARRRDPAERPAIEKIVEKTSFIVIKRCSCGISIKFTGFPCQQTFIYNMSYFSYLWH